MRNAFVALLGLLSLTSSAFAMSTNDVVAAVESLGDQNVREIKPAANQPQNPVGGPYSETIEITVLSYTPGGPILQTHDITVMNGEVQSSVVVSR